ncbi:cuticlin 2-like [Schistocerca nitens]|uniref:cuticlin 2-like n=1 Tax=Schistocerca nitens TaxID=7011 RepID=UPI002119543F|nr:cuticlin 2-like [Schistocerca nitens]
MAGEVVQIWESDDRVPPEVGRVTASLRTAAAAATRDRRPTPLGMLREAASIAAATPNSIVRRQPALPPPPPPPPPPRLRCGRPGPHPLPSPSYPRGATRTRQTADVGGAAPASSTAPAALCGSTASAMASGKRRQTAQRGPNCLPAVTSGGRREPAQRSSEGRAGRRSAAPGPRRPLFAVPPFSPSAAEIESIAAAGAPHVEYTAIRQMGRLGDASPQSRFHPSSGATANTAGRAAEVAAFAAVLGLILGHVPAACVNRATLHSAPGQHAPRRMETFQQW